MENKTKDRLNAVTKKKFHHLTKRRKNIPKYMETIVPHDGKRKGNE